MQLIGGFAVIGLLALMACMVDTDLRDQFKHSDFTLPFEERLRFEITAPVIVVGKVIEIQEVGAAMKSPGDHRINTQSARIRIEVEVVIRGHPAPGSLSFFFFAYSRTNDFDLGVPRYTPEVGQRRIYFLKPWKDSYRSVGDVTNYNLPLRSGWHTGRFCEGKQSGCCIADLLLVPGKEFDAESFAREIGPAAYVAMVLCSRESARTLVETLKAHPDSRISRAAIDILSMEDWR